MFDAAYRCGLKAFDESAGRARIRGMGKYLAIFLHTANDAVVKEPAHELTTIIAAASRQMVRVERDRFRCRQMPRLIHALFHKV